MYTADNTCNYANRTASCDDSGIDLCHREQAYTRKHSGNYHTEYRRYYDVNTLKDEYGKRRNDQCAYTAYN